MTDSVGLYLHIPFCRQRCAYCDFYSGFAGEEMIRRYVTALCAEIQKQGGLYGRPVATVYFGGGTPSLLSARQVDEILHRVTSAFSVADHAGITLECNPGDQGEEWFRQVKKSGVNRLSFGVQSSMDACLSRLRRNHTFHQAQTALAAARKAGFENCSVDWMLGLPGSDDALLAREAEAFLSLEADHVSCYMLSLEENTLFSRRRQDYVFPDAEAVARQYLAACERLRSAGYRHYEISNFCRPGKEGRQNLIYWKDREYLGIGPGAYSYLDGRRFHTPPDLHAFLRQPQSIFDEPGGGYAEWIMLSLRLADGFSKEELARRFHKTTTAAFETLLSRLKEAGYATENKGRIALTERGWLVSNSVICEMEREELYADLPDLSGASRVDAGQ